MKWNELKKLIVPGSSCVLTTHYSLDGDAIGSELALAGLLTQLGARPHIVNHDAVPRIYRFLDPGNIARPFGELDPGIVERADLVFVLDVSNWERIGEPAQAIRRSHAKVICIDHHATSDGIADIDIIEPAAAATGIMIYDMIQALGAKITPPMAAALFVAIATDTGWFRFSNTSPAVFRAIAGITEAGAVPAEIYSFVYENLRWERLHLLKSGLGTLRSAAGGKVAWMTLSRGAFEESGADEEDVEGLIDFLRSIAGVEVAILFRESPAGVIRISMRSKSRIDVGRFAERFGGGGHARAAGIKMSGRLSDVTERVLAAVDELFGSKADVNV